MQPWPLGQSTALTHLARQKPATHAPDWQAAESVHAAPFALNPLPGTQTPLPTVPVDWQLSDALHCVGLAMVHGTRQTLWKHSAVVQSVLTAHGSPALAVGPVVPPLDGTHAPWPLPF